MKNELKIRNLKIDEKKLYFCGTILEEDIRTAIEQTEVFLEQGVDMLEIRGDALVQRVQESKAGTTNFGRDVSVIRMIKHIREKATDIPLLFTIRSRGEGGEFAGTVKEYNELIEIVSLADSIDIIDLEMDMVEYSEEKNIDYIHSNKIKVVLSKHITKEVPFEERMKMAEEALKRQERSVADILKIALYVESEEQLEKYRELLKNHPEWMKRPHIGIAMGEAGMVSRYKKEWCGSCMSFVCGKKVVAPGQLTMETIKGLCYNS